MVTVKEEKIVITTYEEPAAEEMPMFAENRVHQRTSGNPYPNHIVLEVNRESKKDKEYTVIALENEYLKIEILPEIGGRIYSALDKTTGYDFFYKQHVIKPALIGCLGSWISGGMEFNFPFHHRPSTFMPVDYKIEYLDNGGACVWLSEHDPIDRIKGMVGIVLNPGEAKFETRVRVYNRTTLKKSFLWWENTAVPVNKDYQIFYPKDVSYVNFHYKRSVTTYPVATNALGVYNGIRYGKETDISMHKNTVSPTSYFSAPSEYDFFGGYDHQKACGVVHIANHHISPGKKMFTWAYNQLSKSWENALTDEDGAYAELMAGSYSDNQPDFAWIEPYETKEFSQFWFPIGNVGVPCFANINGAMRWDENAITVQTTKNHEAEVSIYKNGELLYREKRSLKAGIPCKIENNFFETGCRTVISENGKTLLDYTEQEKKQYNIPETTTDMPNYKEVKTAQELYFEGVHVNQYRDPKISPDAYWREALLREPEHFGSLLALSEFEYIHNRLESAAEYARKAESAITKYNKHPESGRLYYTMGLICLAGSDMKRAYDYFYKSSWNMDFYSAAMTKLSAIDGKNGDYDKMLIHSENALKYNQGNMLARGYAAAALIQIGERERATAVLDTILKQDPLIHFARYLCVVNGKLTKEKFYSILNSDMARTCLDTAFELFECGMDREAMTLLADCNEKSPLIYYILGDYHAAETTELKSAFPSGIDEYLLLKRVTDENLSLPMAEYYYGCLLYGSGNYEEAYRHFKASSELNPDFYIPYRNMAIAKYSHLGGQDEVLPLLDKALSLKPCDKQLVFETAYVMAKLGVAPTDRIAFILKNTGEKLRDDIAIELARAYNQNGEYEKAIELLKKHTFVPCEGGEHAVAEQYMFAHLSLGRKYMRKNDFESAAKALENGLVLPQSLGAGLWNECKNVPIWFYLALCCQKLGKSDRAQELYSNISILKVDYFSNMHLPELPYYLARVHEINGDFLSGRAIIDACLKKWSAAMSDADPGYFGTTPFFISYVDNAKTAREAYYSYLLGFCYHFMGDREEAKKLFEKAYLKEKANIFYYGEAIFELE